MIAFRYKLKNVPMKIAEKSFTADGVEFPAGSFVIAAGADLAAVEAAVEQFGLTAAALDGRADGRRCTTPTCRAIAIYSSWNGTQEIGWYRFTFDKFGIPYDLIYKERVKKGNLRADYDVIVMPTQTAIGAAGGVRAAGGAAGAVPEDRQVQVPRRCTASRPTSPAAWAAKASTRSPSSSTPAAR